MDDLIRIPCVIMRGGTSKGPFFLSGDLPADPGERDRVLLEILGSGHPLQIDGIGGGNPLSSKVAIVGPPTRPDADVDYLFAQVKVEDRIVDTSPNCGNMLSGVGPFAIEAGLVDAKPGATVIKIHNVNTGTLIDAKLQTPDARVTYDGSARIDGVPGTAAPILLAFREAVGARSGRLLPTGAPVEIIDGVEATLVDGAMPLVVMRAESLGVTGTERPAELDADRRLMSRIETIRCEAGLRMGLGDVAGMVVPKPVLATTPRRGGNMTVRYFMPASCHTALATTGAVSLALAAVTPGTIPALIAGPLAPPCDIGFEHPGGRLDVRVEPGESPDRPVAYVLRTARRLFEGSALVRRPSKA